MTKLLIIFIDGLPFAHIHAMPFLYGFAHRAPLEPGLGYSVNIKAEMFAGLQPDDAGFLGLWNYRPPQDAPWWQRVLSPLHGLRRSPTFDRGVHKTLERLGATVQNIPFGLLPFFRLTGNYSVYDADFGTPTVLSKVDDISLATADHWTGRDRDQRALAVAHRSFNHAVIYLSLAGVDQAGHRLTTQSDAYHETLCEYDGALRDLIEGFLGNHSDSDVIVLSDHGMTDVFAEAELNLEKIVGPLGADSYVYFLDSTMLRVWCFDDAIRRQVTTYLGETSVGGLLSENERMYFGVRSRAWGDLIFILNEGHVFAPSFFNLGRVPAMHGYHPKLESQQGVFLLYSGKPMQPVRRALDVYPYLVSALGLGVDR